MNLNIFYMIKYVLLYVNILWHIFIYKCKNNKHIYIANVDIKFYMLSYISILYDYLLINCY